jgi:alcohol dehydrogenase
MELRKFLVSEFLMGNDALRLAGRYAANFGAHKVLIVTDPGIIEAGWVKPVEDSLDAEGINYVVFSNVTPNPKDYEVMEGSKIFQQEKCDVITAVGGGSPMDCAKGIGIVCSNHKHITEFEGVDEVKNSHASINMYTHHGRHCGRHFTICHHYPFKRKQKDCHCEQSRGS